MPTRCMQYVDKAGQCQRAGCTFKEHSSQVYSNVKMYSSPSTAVRYLTVLCANPFESDGRTSLAIYEKHTAYTAASAKNMNAKRNRDMDSAATHARCAVCAHLQISAFVGAWIQSCIRQGISWAVAADEWIAWSRLCTAPRMTRALHSMILPLVGAPS